MRSKSKPKKQRLDATGMTGLIVASRFNGDVVDKLVEGAVAAFRKIGGKEIGLVRVPGALEIPLAIAAVHDEIDLDFAVALGCVIRGETSHYDLVIAESLKHCMAYSMDFGLPIGHGILTVENMEQALERTGGKFGNKGEDAMLAAVEMAMIQQGGFVDVLE